MSKSDETLYAVEDEAGIYGIIHAANNNIRFEVGTNGVTEIKVYYEEEGGLWAHVIADGKTYARVDTMGFVIYYKQ